tara:strand:+ start:303 stop:491 length:189 start_codon:yes stop_codon:yes gene_type:complete
MKRILSMFFFLMFFLIIISCEDDALLDPQVDSESDGGSYGNLSLPGDLDEDYSKINDNPEVF